MAKEFLHKEGLTKLVENIKAWCKGAFLGKDATITKSSGTNKGVSVSIQGSVSEPSVSVSVTTGGVSENNSGIVSGVEVKTYVDKNAATKDTFKAATSSSNAVNGLVPAPSSANATKFLRGDGSWTTPPLATNNTDGLMSATDKTTLDQSVAMVTPMTGDDGSCVLEVERNDGTYLEFPVPKVGSAKEADNAAKVGGKDVKALQNFMFNGDTPRYIPVGTDLDTLYGEDKCGFWNSYDNIDYGNCPAKNFGLLVVRINTSYFAQLLIPFDAGGSEQLIRYRSQYYDSVQTKWNAWREIVRKEDLKKYIERSASEVFLGNRGNIGTDDVANLPCGLHIATNTVGGLNPIPLPYSSIVQFGEMYYSPQMCVKHDCSQVWFRNITRTPTGNELTDWNEVAFKKDIIDGNITAAKATTADSANAIGGKGLDELVQGGGTIKHIKVVTSLPANPSNDTLYLIKQ